jgi:hypothetical protein
MPKQILLVINDTDTEDLVRDIVKQRLAGHRENGKELWWDFDYARCEEDAIQKIETSQYDLLITQLGIPKTTKTSLAEEEKRGLKVLECVKSKGLELPSIVLTKHFDGRLNLEMKDFERCELVEVGERLEESLKKSLDRFIGRKVQDQVEQRHPVDVEIKLETPSRGSYRIKVTSPDLYCNEGPLTIAEGSYKRLLEASEELDELSEEEKRFERWRKKLRSIGENLLTELFNNKDFSRDFFSATRDHIEKSRIVFNVKEPFYPIPLEAIWDKRKEFWMLEAPVMRRLPRQTQVFPLFTTEETKNTPINCLIIESPAAGYVDEKVGELRELDNVSEECEWLENFLTGKEKIEPSVQFERVLRIREGAEGKSFAKHVEETLKETWHVVHYAGHSYYDTVQREGYVFFPGEQIEKVDIEDFARLLRRTNFVYMSSCHSSESSIVFELARNLIPAIVGFRWDIEDSRAAEHARIFYSDLFTRSRSIEYAFLKARKEMYKKYKNEHDKTWAAAMLILQLTG